MTRPPATLPADPPDARLLARFVRDRDPVAFAELVRRYGPLVLGVCRRVIPDRHLADDAFQAAFVVLARKPETVRAGAPLGSWLYGVAFRVALRARTMAGRRARRETLTAEVPEQHERVREVDDATAILDEEIAKLSDHLRAAVVLCELQGVSRKEAAKQLGVAEGTLSSRLAAARKRLADALRRRGVTLGVSGLLVQNFLPSDLFAATVRVSTGAEGLNPHILKLVEGATPMLLLNKLKLVAVAVLVLAVGGFGGLGVWRSAESAAAPVPKEGKGDGLIWTHNAKTGKLAAYTPDGKAAKELTLKDGAHFLGLTPDGTRIAFAGKKGKLAADGETDGLTLHVRDVSDQTDGTDTGLSLKPGDVFHWSPDGRQVVRVHFGEPDKAGGMTHEHTLFDLATKKEKRVELPVNLYVVRWSPDGKAWHLHEYVRADLRNPNLPRYRMMSVPAGGGEPKSLCDTASLTTFEPADGKAFFGVGNAHKNPADDTDATYRRWFRVSDTGQTTLVKQFDEFHFIDLRVSPDRERVVVLGFTGSDESSDAELRLYDPDGGDERKLLTLPKAGHHTRLLGWFPKHPDAPVPRRKNAPVPKPEPREGVILLSSFSERHQLEVVKPDGTPVEVAKPTGAFSPWLAKLSADGKRAAFPEPASDSGNGVNGWAKFRIRWLELEAEELKPKEIIDEAYLPTVAWAADGKRVYGSHVDVERLNGAPKQGEPLPFRTWVYDPATDKKEAVKLPPEHAVVGASPDGKTLLTRTTEFGTQKQVLYLTPLATLKPEKFGDAPVAGLDAPRFSPDGKRLLWARRGGVRNATGEPGVYVTDVATKKETKLDLPKGVEASGVHHVCWSPDGKRIALCWYEQVPRPKNMPVPVGPGGATVSAARVTVCDADGSNPKVIVRREAESGAVTGLDWR